MDFISEKKAEMHRSSPTWTFSGRDASFALSSKVEVQTRCTGNNEEWEEI